MPSPACAALREGTGVQVARPIAVAAGAARGDRIAAEHRHAELGQRLAKPGDETRIVIAQHEAQQHAQRFGPLAARSERLVATSFHATSAMSACSRKCVPCAIMSWVMISVSPPSAALRNHRPARARRGGAGERAVPGSRCGLSCRPCGNSPARAAICPSGRSPQQKARSSRQGQKFQRPQG